MWSVLTYQVASMVFFKKLNPQQGEEQYDWSVEGETFLEIISVGPTSSQIGTHQLWFPSW